jgi:hypothetical protein
MPTPSSPAFIRIGEKYWVNPSEPFGHSAQRANVEAWHGAKTLKIENNIRLLIILLFKIAIVFFVSVNPISIIHLVVNGSRFRLDFTLPIFSFHIVLMDLVTTRSWWGIGGADASDDRYYKNSNTAIYCDFSHFFTFLLDNPFEFILAILLSVPGGFIDLT